LSNYIGEIAALGTALCWSFGSVFFTISSRRIGHHTVNRLRLVVGLLFLSVTHYFITGYLFPQGATGYHWFWFGLSGIIGFALGDTLLFRSFVLVGPRLGMLMMSLVPVFSTLIAWLFLHEILDYTDIIAIIVTIVGISWVVLTRGNHRQNLHGKDHYTIGLLCGVGGALGQAVGLILSKKGLNSNFSPLAGNIIRVLIATIAIWIVSIITGQIPKTLKSLKDKTATRTMCGGAFLGPFLGVWLSLFAVKYAYVGIASTLMALPPILLIPLSHWIFKEKITTGAVLGTIIAVIGVTLIFLL
jgi:drug/metabolite transporter (DMT)-like permease